ncbi:hypothetical protein AXG53_09690 [Stenotrophomonas sp. KCTC 12332]|nr:hypothetical protein AXG53_09690 [Stenotrophomonas sp. KCTC 12332]
MIGGSAAYALQIPGWIFSIGIFNKLIVATTVVKLNRACPQVLPLFFIVIEFKAGFLESRSNIFPLIINGFPCLSDM